MKLLMKNFLFFFLSHSLRVHLNRGNFLITFKIAHVKIVQHPRIPVFIGGCGHIPSFSFPLCQVRDLAALSSGCLLLVAVSLARHALLANLPAQPGQPQVLLLQCSLWLKMLRGVCPGTGQGRGHLYPRPVTRSQLAGTNLFPWHSCLWSAHLLGTVGKAGWINVNRLNLDV